MRPSLNFLGAAVLAFGVSSIVAKVAQEGKGPVSAPTASYNKGPDSGKKEHRVTVAQTSHRFSPQFVNATIGDVITFIFYPTTHSATLADYRSPCVPWSSQHIGEQDVWSGLITEEKARTNPQTWTWRVDTKDPRFFYCSGPESCVRWGMVFAVNPSVEQTFETFQANAKQADYQMSPGQTPPDESPTTNTGSKKTPTPPGVIAGIVVGAVAAVAVVGLLFFLIGRSRRNSASEKAAATAASLAQPTVDVGPVPGVYGDHAPPGVYGDHAPPGVYGDHAPPGVYGDHAPPGYYGKGQLQAWDGKGLAPPAPPLSPVHSQYNRHSSRYGSPEPTNPHASWAPSELGGESATQSQRVEIYTPGVDDRIPLNNPPKSP